MADGLRVEITGAWDSFENALDGRAFQKRLDQEMLRAHERIGREYVRTARRAILSSAYESNSPLTVALKGSTRPLIGRTGSLLRAIGYEAGPRQLNVGLDPSKAGPKLTQLAVILHEGATIDLRKHPQVRQAVWAQAREAVGAARLAQLSRRNRSAVIRSASSAGIRAPRRTPMSDRQRRAFFARQPKAPRTGLDIWRIPPRPFLLEPLNAPRFVRFVGRAWSQAVERALFPPGVRTR